MELPGQESMLEQLLDGARLCWSHVRVMDYLDAWASQLLHGAGSHETWRPEDWLMDPQTFKVHPAKPEIAVAFEPQECRAGKRARLEAGTGAALQLCGLPP